MKSGNLRPEAVEITLSLDYRIKDRTPLTPVVDLVFVRRAMGDALRRTVTRFANERKAEQHCPAFHFLRTR